MGILDDPSTTFSVLVFAVVFIVVAAVGLHLSKPPKILDKKPPAKFARPPSTSQFEASHEQTASSPRPSDALADIKQALHAVSRVLAFIIVASLAALTVASYFATEPNDGSRLLTIVLAAGTAILALHLHRIDRRHRPTSGGGSLETAVVRDGRSDLASMIGAALLRRGKVEWTIAPPEVYSMDQATLERARAMAADGRPMDEICQSIAPEYPQWDAAHQQAYEGVVRAAIEHKG